MTVKNLIDALKELPVDRRNADVKISIDGVNEVDIGDIEITVDGNVTITGEQYE